MSPSDPDATLDRVFSALATPSRRKILALLREVEALRVTDIAAAFEMSLNGVSKHLKVLERAGLVTRRVEGRVHWIGADWEGLSAAHSYLDAHHHFWDRRLTALHTHLEENP